MRSAQLWLETIIDLRRNSAALCAAPTIWDR
jgi:hypothetical protein